MRIIKEMFLVEMGRKYPKAASHLETWRKTVKAAAWRNLVKVRRTYPDTDSVKVRSGRQVLVFNVRRNDCRLIEDYENEHARLAAPKVSGLDALRHLLEAHEMNAADLSRLLGAHRTLGAMILRGERQLTLSHVRKLSEHFGVPADLFLPD